MYFDGLEVFSVKMLEESSHNLGHGGETAEWIITALLLVLFSPGAAWREQLTKPGNKQKRVFSGPH